MSSIGASCRSRRPFGEQLRSSPLGPSFSHARANRVASRALSTKSGRSQAGGIGRSSGSTPAQPSTYGAKLVRGPPPPIITGMLVRNAFATSVGLPRPRDVEQLMAGRTGYRPVSSCAAGGTRQPSDIVFTEWRDRRELSVSEAIMLRWVIALNFLTSNFTMFGPAPPDRLKTRSGPSRRQPSWK